MQIIYDNSNSLLDLIEKINSFTIIKNGNQSVVSNSTQDFNKIKTNLAKVFALGRLEPAFGVSLHNLTVQEIKNDNWLKINFNNEQVKNDLPFTSLLIKLEKTGGFNLIREFNNKYDGRCLFLHLEKTTDLNSVIS